jgi:hypothetical protein
VVCFVCNQDQAEALDRSVPVPTVVPIGAPSVPQDVSSCQLANALAAGNLAKPGSTVFPRALHGAWLVLFFLRTERLAEVLLKRQSFGVCWIAR